MIFTRPLLVLLVAVFAPAARAKTQPWSVLPLDPYGIPPDQLARLSALPSLPDVLEPLWDRTPAVTLVTNALGPPDMVDGLASIWLFGTLRMSITEQSSVTLVEIIPHGEPDPAHARQFDPRGLPLAAILAVVPGRCSDVMALLGRPSFLEKHHYAWSSAGKGRDVAIALDCGDTTEGSVKALRLFQCEAVPRDLAALIASSAEPVRLPKRFKQVGASPRALDPRELWPRGFVPGDSVAGLFQKVGVPSLLDTNSGVRMRWALALGAVVADGTLREVALPVQGRPAYARLGVTTPLSSALGGPVAALTDRLGPPVVREDKHRWRWTAEGHEIAITAETELGIVTQLSFTWSPPPRREALSCAALLDQKPSRAPRPVEFRSGDVTYPSSRLVPFGLWFGANHRDVFERLGLPEACDEDGNAMTFPGIALSFSEGRLLSVTVSPELVTAERYVDKDPLLRALSQGLDATSSYLGGQLQRSFFGQWSGIFERGADRIHVAVGPSSTAATSYHVWQDSGFDFGMITGLRLDRLPVAGREAFGLKPLTNAHDVFNGALVFRVDDKPALKSKVGGKVIDLLGAPWSTITTALGAPDKVIIEGDVMRLIWDPTDRFERKLAYVCIGDKPTCNELHLSGGRE